MAKLETRNSQRAAARAAAREASETLLVPPPPLVSFVESAFASRVEYARWAAEMEAGK